MALFPGALPVAGTASSTDTLAAAGHTALHNTDRDEIRAIATKVGTGASTPAANQVLRGTGAGTSEWGQVDLASEVSGVLPVANGGTGESTQTGTGLPVAQDSPTIDSPTLTTPTIASFTNAQHNHEDAAGGGQLGTDALADTSVTSEKLSATVAFRARTDTAQNTGNGAFAAATFELEDYDLGSDFASSEFTAPYDGIYFFTARFHTAVSTVDRILISLFKDTGSGYAEAARGSDFADAGATTTAGVSALVAADLKLDAGDKVKVYSLGNTTHAWNVTDSATAYFTGHLVGRT